MTGEDTEDVPSGTEDVPSGSENVTGGTDDATRADGTRRVRAKICGLTSEGDLRLAADAGADAVGVITDVPVDTPREVTPARAADLLAAAPPFVTTVLVTMPETAEEAIDLVERLGPDALQVHGSLDRTGLERVAVETDVTLLRVVDAEDPAAAATVADVADVLLVDSVSEDGGGGTGRTHDWERTRAATADLDVPVVLAGGLTPDNVARAIRTVEPYGVDVASGVERDGGVKDPDAVRAFVTTAHATTVGDGDRSQGAESDRSEGTESDRSEESRGTETEVDA